MESTPRDWGGNPSTQRESSYADLGEDLAEEIREYFIPDFSISNLVARPLRLIHKRLIQHFRQPNVAFPAPARENERHRMGFRGRRPGG